VKARSRLLVDGPRRVKPKGAASGWCANHVTGCQGLSKGLKPRNRGPRAGRSSRRAAQPSGKTVSGCFRAVTCRIPFERGKLRRVNPRSAAGVKQNRQGPEGSKPSRG